MGEVAKTSDIYSLGLVLFYITTGKIPYSDISSNRLQEREVWEFWRKIHKEKELDWNNFPTERKQLASIIKGMTAKNAHDRPKLTACITALSGFRSKYSTFPKSTATIPSPSMPRGTFVWHPNVHSYFKQKRRVYIVRSMAFLAAFHSIRENILTSLQGGFGVYAVLGQRDIILTVWSSDEDDTLVELLNNLVSQQKLIESPEVITIDPEKLYISGLDEDSEPTEAQITDFVRKLRLADTYELRSEIIESAKEFWVRKISKNQDDLMAFMLFRWTQPLTNGHGEYYFEKTVKLCAKFTGSFIAGMSEDLKTIILQIRIADYNKVGPLLLELHQFYSGKKSIPAFKSFTSETFLDLLQGQRWVSEDGYLSSKIMNHFGAGS
jgi:serine/threonine protein kinase